MLTIEMMRKMWPHGDAKIPGLIEGMVESAPAVFAKYGVTTPLVVAHIMAQFSWECRCGLEVVENLNYTSSGAMRKAWPKRFPTDASTLPYLRNPKALADKVYNGRMGNREGSDDGYNYRGRAGAQTTGHEGYDKLGRAMGMDLLGNPDAINDPKLFLDAAVADFVLCGCLPFAENDDVHGVTHHLNGGYNGLAERTEWLTRWKAEMSAVHPAAPMSVPRPAIDTLRFGDHSEAVKALQARLNALDYLVGAPDGDFSAETRGQLLRFQADAGVPTTGELDAATRVTLDNAKPKPIAESRVDATADDLRKKGSGTIASADTISTIGKVVVGTAATGGAADSTGGLDKLKDAVGEVSGWRTVIESIQDLGTWAVSHWYLAAIVAGGLAWYFGKDIIAKRLADHKSGANMGR